MAETVIKEVVMIEDITLSQVIWKKFKRQPAGYIDRVLEMNPDLAGTIYIPVGTEITFPVEDLNKSVANPGVTRLWD